MYMYKTNIFLLQICQTNKIYATDYYGEKGKRQLGQAMSPVTLELSDSPRLKEKFLKWFWEEWPENVGFKSVGSWVFHQRSQA